MFVLQTTENSEKRGVEIQQTKLNSYYKQIKTSECRKLFFMSGKLFFLHKTPTPWIVKTSPINRLQL